MDLAIRFDNGLGLSILDGFRENGIAIVIVEDKDVIVPVTGWADELSCEIGMHCIGRFHYGGVTVVAMLFLLVGGIEGLGVVVVVDVLGELDLFLFGAALVFLCLIKMSFYHRY